jgi:two-component system, NtrC family, nitrogen regulation response regulator GlnG
MADLLILDLQPSRRLLLRRLAEAAGFAVRVASAVDDAVFDGPAASAVIVDPACWRELQTRHPLPDWWSRARLILSAPLAAEEPSDLPVLAANPDVEALRAVLDRPAEGEELHPWTEAIPDAEFLTCDPRCEKMLDDVARLADRPIAVLVEGESGTGKELVARALHEQSSRRDQPFVAINCSAIPAELLESEVFGHERGAFTDALRQHQGCFERAGEGTILLDEIGDMPLRLQPKLLRVLEARVLIRVGGEKEVPVKARILAATHRDLGSRVESGEFRGDLYHRLAVARLRIPPLRDRPADLKWLSAILLRRIAEEYEQSARRLSAATWHRFQRHRWPGNVRELENFLRRSLLIETSSPLELWPDPTESRDGSANPAWVEELETYLREKIEGGSSLEEAAEDARRALEAALDRLGSKDPSPGEKGEHLS